MEKRGQVTTYVLVGVLVVFVIGSLLYAQRSAWSGVSGVSRGITYPPKVQEVVSVVESCAQQTVEEGLRVLGVQGGYETVPERLRADTSVAPFAYWYMNGQRFVPSLNDIQQQVNVYVGKQFGACMDKATFSGVEVSAGAADASSMIREDGVLVQVAYPLSVSADGKVSQVNERYSVFVAVPLQTMHAYASGVVEKTIEDAEFVDVVYLAESGFAVEVTPLPDGSLVYALTEKGTSGEGVPFQLVFGVSG